MWVRNLNHNTLAALFATTRKLEFNSVPLPLFELVDSGFLLAAVVFKIRELDSSQNPFWFFRSAYRVVAIFRICLVPLERASRQIWIIKPFNRSKFSWSFDLLLDLFSTLARQQGVPNSFFKRKLFQNKSSLGFCSFNQNLHYFIWVSSIRTCFCWYHDFMFFDCHVFLNKVPPLEASLFPSIVGIAFLSTDLVPP